MAELPQPTAAAHCFDDPKPCVNAEAIEFYRRAIESLNRRDVPFLIGGAFAFAHYTGIQRDTRDLDIFVRPRDCQAALHALAMERYRVELTFPHWLGKAFNGNRYVDVIFSAGNGVARVDDAWFEHAEAAEVLGHTVRLCPPEETIWSKAFVIERERCDIADVSHLILHRGERLQWPRLLERFGPHWRVLLAHLVLFSFVYPSERSRVPTWVMDTLAERLRREHSSAAPAQRLCQGTLLSREQYLADLVQGGFHDARLLHGYMNEEDVRRWTAAIPRER